MGIFDWLRGRGDAKDAAAREDRLPSDPARRSTLPTPLSDLMARVLDDPSEPAWVAFHQAFLRSPVGVIASDAEGGGTGLARAATPDGRVMVLACADRDAFAQTFHDRFNRLILGRELARAVLAIPDCHGILLNSAASFNSLAIPREQIPGLLERYPAL